MANFYDEVLEVLKQDARFFAEDGTLLRNAVYEAAMQMDEFKGNRSLCKSSF